MRIEDVLKAGPVPFKDSDSAHVLQEMFLDGPDIKMRWRHEPDAEWATYPRNASGNRGPFNAIVSATEALVRAECEAKQIPPTEEESREACVLAFQQMLIDGGVLAAKGIMSSEMFEDFKDGWQACNKWRNER